MAQNRLSKAVRIAVGAAGRDVSNDALERAVAGKIVLITGASSGIGAATARRVGAAGAIPILVARSVDALEEVCADIIRNGGQAHVYPADLRDADAVARLVSTITDAHGRVDIIVNNAGLSIRRWLSESHDRFHDMERSNAINFIGPTRLITALLPPMRSHGDGHIINVSTILANTAGVEWSAYVSTKTAFDSWFRSISPEIAADGIASTTIYMMLVRTPMLGPELRNATTMSADEAAGMVVRAMVTQRRVVIPLWARVGIPLAFAAQEPVDRALTRYARVANPASRPASVTRMLRSGHATAQFASDVVGAAAVAAKTGAVKPIRPDRPVRALLAVRRYGPSLASVSAVGAALWGDRTAIVDEYGELTYVQLNDRVSRIAAALSETRQVGPGRRLGVMCRNHRGFVEAIIAGARVGSDIVPLNTDFAGPQLGEVLTREAVDAVIADDEFMPALDSAGFQGLRIIAFDARNSRVSSLDDLIERGKDLPSAPAPSKSGAVIMLTSGTTGTPKGANSGKIKIKIRALLPMAVSGASLAARFDPVPRSGDSVLICPPLYHVLGFGAVFAALAAGSPVVLNRRFDPQEVLSSIEKRRVGVLVAVPTMLKRIMDLPEQTRTAHDCSSLRVAFSAAAPLSASLGSDFMDAFGDILFNAYGSTEIGAGSLAMPADLRAAPGTVGQVSPGITMKILDDDGAELPTGATGRVFIGSPLLFAGYTGGGTKEIIDGMMNSGDVGHFDSNGRLFIDGRDDDMIVSGGENVFPQEVESLVAAHDEVADAAAVGFADHQFGQRLALFVVPKEGSQVSAENLRDHVRANLARYKVPRDVVFVSAIPRTSTGKIKRAKLRLPVAAERGVPSPARAE